MSVIIIMIVWPKGYLSSHFQHSVLHYFYYACWVSSKALKKTVVIKKMAAMGHALHYTKDSFIELVNFISSQNSPYISLLSPSCRILMPVRTDMNFPNCFSLLSNHLTCKVNLLKNTFYFTLCHSFSGILGYLPH